MPGMVRLETLERAPATPVFYFSETLRSPLKNFVPTERAANILSPHSRELEE